MKIVTILLEVFCVVFAMSVKQRSSQLNTGSGNQLLWYFLNKVEKLDTKIDKIQLENTEIKSKLNGLQTDVRLLKGKTQIWLGGNDPTGRNTWMWSTDFTELNYQNWSPGNPDDNNEKCMMMYSKSFQWNDGECYSKRGGYICEKRL
ncbi:asialoglycoprotein receptor 1-like [Mytilus trossulus]|uniref:asialoglycoprotein receptor 1-like n=1 Tax=Mytilus trossulus TaxID=6551 RepID=UPI003005C4B8